VQQGDRVQRASLAVWVLLVGGRKLGVQEPALSGLDLLWVGLAALIAGLVNALAGGGTLITFPTLLAVGMPAVAANVTNTVALCPGFFGATLAQLKDLQGQKARLWLVVPAGIVGGVIGGVILLNTGERVFRALVPFLILTASVLLAVQAPLRTWLTRASSQHSHRVIAEKWVALPVGLVAIYGGYFGAGMSVIQIGLLGLLLDDNLTRLNALKQTIALAVNLAAAILFIFSGKVVWPAAAVMAAGALIGGSLGGRLARWIKPAQQRWVIVGVGVVVGVSYLVR
jgi:uncharacterized membrane protein YfcA